MTMPPTTLPITLPEPPMMSMTTKFVEYACVNAVSYTHLDVYKRQYPHRKNNLLLCLGAVFRLCLNAEPTQDLAIDLYADAGCIRNFHKTIAQDDAIADEVVFEGMLCGIVFDHRLEGLEAQR